MQTVGVDEIQDMGGASRIVGEQKGINADKALLLFLGENLEVGVGVLEQFLYCLLHQTAVHLRFKELNVR